MGDLPNHQVGKFKNEIHRAAITYQAFVRVANPVKYRKTDAQQRLAQLFSGLAAMRMGDEQVAMGSRRADFQVFQIAQNDLFGGQQRVRGRFGGADAAAQFRAHLVQQAAHGQQQVRLGGNRHLHAAGVEVAIEHGV